MLYDQLIKAGEGIIALNQSANRDEDIFENPDKFDIHRTPGPQLGFGHGVHECIAEWLARAELEIALSAYFSQQILVAHLTMALSVSYIIPKTTDLEGGNSILRNQVYKPDRRHWSACTSCCVVIRQINRGSLCLTSIPLGVRDRFCSLKSREKALKEKTGF